MSERELVAGTVRRPRVAVSRLSYSLSVVVAALMAGAAAWGVLVPGVYDEVPWAEAALRGGDLVSLVVVVPLLCVSLARAERWDAARLAWGGVLAYNVYNYAYFVFGTRFNDVFLAHILVLSLSAWGLVFLLRDVRASTDPHLPVRSAQMVAALLGVVATVLGGMWAVAVLRQAVTGALPVGAAPPAGLHTVYAVDLTFFVSSLLVSSLLVWRRGAWGRVAGAVMSTAAALYLLNLMAAQLFQSRAGVEGVAAFSPVSASLFVLFAAATYAMLRDPSPPVTAGR
jgi:hypothetical protein